MSILRISQADESARSQHAFSISQDFSLLVAGVRSLATALFQGSKSLFSPLLGGTRETTGDPLTQKLISSSIFTQVFEGLKKNFQPENSQTKENRQQAVNVLRKGLVHAVGSNMSQDDLLKVIKTLTEESSSPQVSKYVNKLLPKALKLTQSADLPQLKEDIKQVIKGFEAEYGHGNQIGNYSIKQLKLSKGFDLEVLKVLDAKSPLQLRDTPENQQLAQKLDDGLLERVANAKKTYGEAFIKEMVGYQLTADHIAGVLGSTELPTAQRYLTLKGTAWVHEHFEPQVAGLRAEINQILSSVEREINEQPSLLNSVSKHRNLSLLVETRLSAFKTQEPWVHMPDFFQHQLSTACSTALERGFLSQLAKFNDQLLNKVNDWHAELFQVAQPGHLDRVVPPHLKEEKAVALYSEFESSVRGIGMSDNLFMHLIHHAVQKPLPYRLFSGMNKAGPSLMQFDGGYFKAYKNTAAPRLAATQVKAASGKVYELLNHLTPEASKALFDQYGLKRDGKVVLGAGGFGKVRFARDLNTRQIVAVKKFVTDAKVLANEELSKVNLVQGRAASKGPIVRNSLASVLDYAHVEVPSRGETNAGDVSGKSYVFMPLINGGDGSTARRHLRSLRERGEIEKANTRFLHIAKGYAESVKNLHQLGLHHRDIKLPNFMHSWVKHAESGQPVEQLKLIDFGFLETSEEQKKYGISSFMYMPPEGQTVEGRTHYDAELHDSYSLGMSLFELLKGQALNPGFPLSLNLKHPDGEFRGLPLQTHFQHFDWRYPNELCCKGVASAHLKNLASDHIDNIIAKLLAADPSERMTATEAFEAFQKLGASNTQPKKTVRWADDLGRSLLSQKKGVE